MPIPFQRTLRDFESENHRGPIIVLATAAILFLLWSAWLVLARVDLYEVSAGARIEVDSMPRQVDTPVDGRVESSRLKLGMEVTEGDVLVTLDSLSERIDTTRTEQRVTELETQIDALKAEAANERSALQAAQRDARLRTLELQADVDAFSARLEAQRAEVARRRALFEEKIVSEADLLSSEADLEELTSRLKSATVAASRSSETSATEIADRLTRIQRLNGSALERRAQLDIARTEVLAAENEQEQRLIRAPVSGRLGSLTPLTRGNVVTAGTRICTIIPRGSTLVIAKFPATSAGKLEVGQRARLHLDGFPSEQYGALESRVERVAGEIQEGLLRVELSLERTEGSAIPLLHGLPGRVEAKVERVRPLDLLLRSAGRLIKRSESV